LFQHKPALTLHHPTLFSATSSFDRTRNFNTLVNIIILTKATITCPSWSRWISSPACSLVASFALLVGGRCSTSTTVTHHQWPSADKTGLYLYSDRAHTDAVFSLTLVNADLLASGSFNTIKLWGVYSGRRILLLRAIIFNGFQTCLPTNCAAFAHICNHVEGFNSFSFCKSYSRTFFFLSLSSAFFNLSALS
jgi:hypothetical protein